MQYDDRRGLRVDGIEVLRVHDILRSMPLRPSADGSCREVTQHLYRSDIAAGWTWYRLYRHDALTSVHERNLQARGMCACRREGLDHSLKCASEALD
jgi:hypothetical protein